MIDQILHRWFKLPYILPVDIYQSPPNPRTTVVLIHGLGGSSHMWKKLVSKLPDDVRVVGIDLLGFGDAPRPRWAKYNATTQAQSVAATLFKIGIRRRVIIVGHSLGALVAVELAKRYSFSIKQLILCSPPFYQEIKEDTPRRRLPDADSLLRTVYANLGKNPKHALAILSLAGKLGIINPGFKVDETNIDAYIATLDLAIINQTSLRDAIKLKVPTTILTGRFDIIVIDGNVKKLVNDNPHVSWMQIPSGHEIKGIYRTALRKAIVRSLSSGL